MIAYPTSLNNPNIAIVDGVILIQKMTKIKKRTFGTVIKYLANMFLMTDLQVTAPC